MRWCAGRNHFRAAFEESILDQTEVILRREMKSTAVDALKKSLTRLIKMLTGKKYLLLLMSSVKAFQKNELIIITTTATLYEFLLNRRMNENLM